MNRKFQGIWIPADLWLYRDEQYGLDITRKALISEIDSLDNEHGCFANNQYFADHFGLSKDWIRKVISELVDCGIIERQMGDFKINNRVVKRVLRIKFRPWEVENNHVVESDHTPMVESDHTPMVESDHHNSTSKNSTHTTEARAFDFLLENYEITLNQWIMKHKRNISNWDVFVSNFNNAVDIEQLPYVTTVLFARLDKLKNNWKSGKAVMSQVPDFANAQRLN